MPVLFDLDYVSMLSVVSQAEYMASGQKATTLNHFYEKLLLLKVRQTMSCAWGGQGGISAHFRRGPRGSQGRYSPPFLGGTIPTRNSYCSKCVDP